MPSGLASSASGSDPQDLAREAGIVGLLASTITAAATQSVWTRVVIFVAAVYALFSGSRSFLKVLAVTHALAWQLPPQRRKMAKPALIFIVIVTAAFIVFQLILWLRDQSFIAGLLAEVLFIAVPTLLWLVLSLRFFAHAPGATWRDLLPGAVLVGVGIQVLHFVTVYWIARLLESKSETYGAIGATLAILFWAYLLGRVFAAAAVLNAAAWQQRHGASSPSGPARRGARRSILACRCPSRRVSRHRSLLRRPDPGGGGNGRCWAGRRREEVESWGC